VREGSSCTAFTYAHAHDRTHISTVRSPSCTAISIDRRHPSSASLRRRTTVLLRSALSAPLFSFPLSHSSSHPHCAIDCISLRPPAIPRSLLVRPLCFACVVFAFSSCSILHLILLLVLFLYWRVSFRLSQPSRWQSGGLTGPIARSLAAGLRGDALLSSFHGYRQDDLLTSTRPLSGHAVCTSLNISFTPISSVMFHYNHTFTHTQVKCCSHTETRFYTHRGHLLSHPACRFPSLPPSRSSSSTSESRLAQHLPPQA
jgi:hypothetical protein